MLPLKWGRARGGGWKKIRAWKEFSRGVPPLGVACEEKNCHIKLVAFAIVSQGTDFVRQISGAFYTTLCHIAHNDLRQFFCRVLEFVHFPLL